jgi:subtilisin family serine protease
MLKVAVVDSGINPFHSHVGTVAGGISFVPPDQTLQVQWFDKLGHGTAVAAAIREKEPAVEMYAVKIFDRSFSTEIEPVIKSLEWCIENKMDLVNLSLATVKAAHKVLLEDISRTVNILVAPFDFVGFPAYPGSFPWVFGVSPDKDCDRDVCRMRPEGHFWASPFPRSLPGLPPQNNFSGPSFAVANLSGILCRTLFQNNIRTAEELRQTFLPKDY